MKKNRLLSIGLPSKILAIDASTNSMAFSIFVDKKLHKYGKINFRVVKASCTEMVLIIL